MKISHKGFSLVELMIVIAIIAILAGIAFPVYANYQVRSKIASEIEKLGSAKAMASEYASNNSGELDYSIDDLGTLPSGASVGDNGAIVLDTSDIVDNSSVSLVPSVGSGSINWSCSATGFSDSQLPSICQSSGNSDAGNNSSAQEGDQSDDGGSSNNSSNISGDFDPSLVEYVDSVLDEDIDCSGDKCFSYGDDFVIAPNDDELYAWAYEGAANISTGDFFNKYMEGKANALLLGDNGVTLYNSSNQNGLILDSAESVQAALDDGTIEQADVNDINNFSSVAKGISSQPDSFCGANPGHFMCQ